MDGDVCRYGDLLMAFFVLLLSFAEVNVPKFKQVAGSIASAFGVARIVPKISIPAATSLVKQEYTPALAEATVIDQKRQRSEDITQRVCGQKNRATRMLILKLNKNSAVFRKHLPSR